MTESTIPVDDPMTLEGFASKIAWEGGIVGALEYGLKARDIPEEELLLRHHWELAQQAWEDFQAVIAPIEDYLDERVGYWRGI